MKATSPNSSLSYRFKFSHGNFGRECDFPHSGNLELVQQPFYSRYERIAGVFSRNLRPELCDLADIAASAYVADRFSPRRHPEEGSNASPRHRRIHMQMDVRHPELWNGAPAKILSELFWFLSHDEWSFSFHEFANNGASPTQQFLLDEFKPNGQPMVMCFSGGLDSFAGAAYQLCDENRFHVLVSGTTHGRMTTGQCTQANNLFRGRPSLGQHVQIPYGLPVKPRTPQESSQRSRGFVHLTLGSITSLHLGARELFVYENGIGAINLPFDASQLGWEVSHPVHPKTLMLMEQLLSAIGHSNFRIRTPFLFSTKAETLRSPAISTIGLVIHETFSCDRFPNYREGTRQCGVCSSCVLRRLALESAGLSHFDPASDYTHDVTQSSPVLKPSAAFVFDKFDAQAFRVKQGLRSANRWSALTRLYPELREVEFILMKQGFDSAEVESKLLRLYSAHVAEWESFSGRRVLSDHLVAA